MIMDISNIFILGFIQNIGGGSLILIILVLLLLFGAKRIPELAKGLGRGIREFKDATKEIKNDIENSTKDDSTTK
jgi:sec-independent protein translocase protein TatA